MYAHILFTFVVELQLHSLSMKSLDAKTFLFLLNKYPCMSSPTFGGLWKYIRVRNQLIPLDSWSSLMMLYIFSRHILEKPTQKYVLRPCPQLLFYPSELLFSFEVSALFLISFRLVNVFGDRLAWLKHWHVLGIFHLFSSESFSFSLR